MTHCSIVFRSITHGQRARELLGRRGIQSTLTRTPGTLGERNCSYRLVLNPRDLPEARAILQDSHLPLLRIHCPGASQEEIP